MADTQQAPMMAPPTPATPGGDGAPSEAFRFGGIQTAEAATAPRSSLRPKRR